MQKIRVYIDTSVFGGVGDEEFAEATDRFFERLRSGQPYQGRKERSRQDLAPCLLTVHAGVVDDRVHGEHGPHHGGPLD